MSFRHILVIVACASFFGCEYFSFKKDVIEPLDTIVDYSQVDTPPAFNDCASLVSTDELNTCFSTTLHLNIAKELQTFSFEVKNPIDEMVMLTIAFSNEGEISYTSHSSSPQIREELPELDSVLKQCIARLPKAFPAIKRGIPVATQYQLPIRIRLKE